MSAAFLSAATARPSSARRPSSAVPIAAGRLVLGALAAGMIADRPGARRASIPGISSRLISLVPSKMRLTRASRKWRSAG